MFKLGKTKASQSKTNDPLVVAPAENIHVMPKKFYVAQKKGNNGLLIIIVVGVLVIGGLAAAAIFLNLSLGRSQTPNQNINTNARAPINSNVNTGNVNSNINTNINTNPNVSTTTENTATTTNSEVNVNVNTNVNSGGEVNEVEVKPLPSAPDSDNDGLTLEEENLFGTDPSLLDSDGDGFADGAELLNGYNPAQSGQTLAASGAFTTYTGKGLYSISYPTSWQVRSQSDNSETLFIANTGEFVAVIIIENSDRLPLAEWYDKQYPDIDIDQAVSVRLNSFSGYRHPDDRIYFLTKSGDLSKIFMVNYNVGNFRFTNFATTFNLMVKSIN